jgi:hypothetical protein
MRFIKSLCQGLLLGSALAAVGCSTEVGQESESVGSEQEHLYMTGARWPAGASGLTTISVCFNAASTARADYWATRAKLMAAVNISWAAAANLRFNDWGSCGASSNGKIEVNLQDAPADGSSHGNADVGYQGTGRAAHLNITVNSIQGGIIHEFGHLLGFPHEMTRPDFPDDTSGSCREANIAGGNTLGTPPDRGSVMAGWWYCGFPENLSYYDIVGVQNAYGVNTFGSGFVWSAYTTGSNPAVDAYSYNSAGGVNTITNTGTGSYRVDFPGLGAVYGGNVQVTAYGGGNERCNVSSWGSDKMTLQVYVRCFNPAGAAVNTTFTASYGRRRGTPGVEGGYVWADQPSTASYTPSPTYQWNSAGGSITIQRTSVGYYTVTFPGQAFTGGTVEVSGYSSNATCKSAGWGQSGSNQLVYVACYSPTGTAMDSYFTAAFSRYSPNQTPAYEYAWADQPTNPSYTASTTYQGGGIPGGLPASALPPQNPIKITRYGTGYYAVSFPNMRTSTSKSNVKVTAYGGTSENCKVSGWGSEIAYVNCYNAAGSAVDSRYTITYSSDLVLVP